MELIPIGLELMYRGKLHESLFLWKRKKYFHNKFFCQTVFNYKRFDQLYFFPQNKGKICFFQENVVHCRIENIPGYCLDSLIINDAGI